MGKLDNLGSGDIDDGNQTGTCQQDCLARINRSPIWVKCGECCLVEANSKDLGEFLDAKRADGKREASEETLRVFSFLFIDPKKNPPICFIKALWQVAHNTLNTCGKTATQSVNLAHHPTKPMTLCQRPS